MHETAARVAVVGQRPGGGVLQRLDDGRLAAAIRAVNERQREEGDLLLGVRVEAAHPLDGQLLKV